MRKQKTMRRSSSSSPPPPSFLSLPYDVVVSCLARISRSHYPILSLVSKSLRSLLASPDLEFARALIARPEKFLYVCLRLNNKPSWFMFSLAPKQKLIPIPSSPNFPHQRHNSSTVVSIGSEIYLIGGSVKGKRSGRGSRRAFLLDCKSHQWLHLPKMRVPRKEAFASVIDGKIFVVGGCSKKYHDTKHFGEVYDPKTQTWSPMTTEMQRIHSIQTWLGLCSTVCLVSLENGSGSGSSASPRGAKIGLFNGRLRWSYGGLWNKVSGQLPSSDLVSVTNPERGRRVIVWWMTCGKEYYRKEIWCAQVLIERLPQSTFRGIVEWSQNVFTFQGCEFGDPDFLLHNALVTHDY